MFWKRNNQQRRYRLGEFMGLPIEVWRRPYQRSLNVRLRPEGLIRITCGSGVPDREILRFVESLGDWLQKCQAQLKLREQQEPKFVGVSGEKFLYLGREIELKKDLKPEAINKMLKEKALILLREKTEELAQKTMLFPRRISMREQSSRWGSCSSTGTISLNWRLIGAPPEVIEYVIIHELAHLEHPNHSPRFWSLVERHFPEHKGARKWLRKNQALLMRHTSP